MGQKFIFDSDYRIGSKSEMYKVLLIFVIDNEKAAPFFYSEIIEYLCNDLIMIYEVVINSSGSYTKIFYNV